MAHISLEIFSSLATIVMIISLVHDYKLSKSIRNILFVGTGSLIIDIISMITPVDMTLNLLSGLSFMFFITLYVHKYKDLAYKDSLTSLYNRHYYTHVRIPEKGALLFIDVDHFKQINDAYGHLTGDAVLQRIGKILRDSSNHRDYAFRIGGDEFVILTGKTTDTIIQRIQIALELYSIESSMDVSVSIGIHHFEHNCENLEELIDKADALMFKRKQSKK